MKKYQLQLTAAFAAFASLPAFAGNLSLLPARELTPAEASALPNTAGVTTLPVTLKTAASVNTSRLGTKLPSAVSRADSMNAAVYTGTDGNGPALPQPAQLAPPVPMPNQFYDFKKSKDAVQAWATMTSEGNPFIHVGGVGQFAADGHASWRTTLPLPAGKSKVYLKFTLPATTIAGVYEENGPGRYRARSRADVLVNGHSVFFGEAVRLNESDPIPSSQPSDCNFSAQERAAHLIPYGDGFGFAGQDDSSKSGAASTSQARTVTLLLGSFDSTESVDVQFVLNAEAMIENKCCQKPKVDDKTPGEIFCSQASAQFNLPATAPVFYIQQ